jgi:hypothetical protein
LSWDKVQLLNFFVVDIPDQRRIADAFLFLPHFLEERFCHLLARR